MVVYWYTLVKEAWKQGIHSYFGTPRIVHTITSSSTTIRSTKGTMVTRMIGIILLVEIVTSLLIIPFSRMVCIIILLVISSSTLLENSFATIELFENSIVHIIPEYLALYIVGEFVRNHHRIIPEYLALYIVGEFVRNHRIV